MGYAFLHQLLDGISGVDIFGYDIERFVPQENIALGNVRPIYTLHYYVPVGYI